MLCCVMCMANPVGESGSVAVSYVGVGAGGGEQSPPMSMQNEASAAPAAPQTPQGGDPGLTVLQPPVSQPQVASAIPPYSTMLPSFGHYATGEYSTLKEPYILLLIIYMLYAICISI